MGPLELVSPLWNWLLTNWIFGVESVLEWKLLEGACVFIIVEYMEVGFFFFE